MFKPVHQFLAFLILSLAGLNLSAAALPFDGGHARVDLVAEQAVVIPGSTVRGALTLDIDDHWHVYWKNPGDSGLPAEIFWDEAKTVQTGAFQWPVPHPQPIETLMNYGFEDRLVLPFDIQVPEDASGAIELRGSVQYLICLDICIPEEAPVQLVLPVGHAPKKSMSAEAFAWADAHMPMSIAGQAVIDRSAGETWRLSIQDEIVRAAFDGEIADVRFFPHDHQILHPPEQPVSIGAEGITLGLQEAPGLGSDGPLTGVLVVEDIGGNRLGFTIEAQPGAALASTKGEALLKGAQAEPTHDGAEPLSLGVLLGVLGAALLGGAILNLMPCVLPVLFIKARSFLSLAGHDDHGKIRQHGIFYLLGVVACFVGFGVALAVLRESGESIGLGFQLQYPPVVAGLALLMFVLGLNMMGMFDFGSSLMGVGSGLAEKGGNTGAFFTGVLAAFVGAPCIGPFLGAATGIAFTQPIHIMLLVFLFLGLGMALPFALLSFFPHLFSALPKPGPWMERLKQFFAFPLFLTAIWLIWVLGKQAGVDAVAAAAIGAVLLTFGIWLLNAAPRAGAAGLVVKAIGLIAMAAGVVLPMGHMSYGSPPQSGEVYTLKENSPYDDVWSPETVEALRAEGRPVFIDFTASWCVTCQVNKRTTFANNRVKDLFASENVAFLVADWTRKDKMIGEELARHGRAGVPLYLFYPGDGGDPVILPQVLSPDLVVNSIKDHVE